MLKKLRKILNTVFLHHFATFLTPTQAKFRKKEELVICIAQINVFVLYEIQQYFKQTNK